MEFDKVNRDHILQGIKDFEEKGIPNGFGASSTYDLVYEGEKFPPKVVMAYANYYAIGKEVGNYFSGGEGTDCFNAFKRNKFDVIPKTKNSIVKYLEEFSAIADDWFNKEFPLEEWYNFYKKFFTRENLAKAEWEDFQEMGNHCLLYTSNQLIRFL